MKKKLLPIALFVLFGALTGCTTPVAPTPEPEPEPEVIIPESTGDFVAPDDIEIYEPFANYQTLNKKNYYSVSTAPATGDVNILVIAAAFSDKEELDQQVLTDLEIAFNGTSEETGWESLHTFFAASSYGALNVNAVVVPEYYRIPLTAAEMNAENSGTTANYVRKAVNWYRSNYKDDCSRFDADSDGLIDSVMLIYDAPNYTKYNYGEGSNLWAYTSWANGTPRVGYPNVDSYFWASSDFLYNSKYIKVDAHTFIHEFGHCLGLPDYYNYDRDSKSNPLGGFDMQSYNVGDHNSHSKFTYGWSKPYVVNGEASITLRRTPEYKDNFIIIPYGGYDNWNKSPFDEYLMLEFYYCSGMNYFDSQQKTYPGYPRGPKGHGIKLTHVDARVLGIDYYGEMGYADEVTDRYQYYDVCATNSTVGAGSGRISYLEEARDYKLIELISKSNERRFEEGGFFVTSDLFVEGDSFSMSEYSAMFFHEGYLNEILYNETNQMTGYASLDISFTVTELTDDYVTVTFTRG